MVTLKQNNENKTFITILKSIKETDWCGNTEYEELDRCLVAINLESRRNSGWYTPSVVKIKGISGMFCVNEDGSLLYDFRIIKTEKGYLKETLTMTGFNKFEKMYSELC